MPSSNATRLFWVDQEFGSHPFVSCGHAEASEFTLFDQVGYLHLCYVLEKLYELVFSKIFKTNYDLFIANSATPVARVLRSELPGTGVVIVSLGLIRCLTALSLRVAVLFQENKFLREDFETRNVDVNFSSFPRTALHGFKLSEEKTKSCGFDEQSLGDLVEMAGGNTALTAIEILCASLEFVVLHEIAHLALYHKEALEYARYGRTFLSAFKDAGVIDFEFDESSIFRQDIRIARCFEHQADYFALRLMFNGAISRPHNEFIRDLSWVGHVFDSKRSRRWLAILGASLSFSSVALFQSPEPGPSEELALQEHATDCHPLPSLRLTVSTNLLSSEISCWWRRLLFFPYTLLNARGFLVQLYLLTIQATILCNGAVNRNWRSCMSMPANDSPHWHGRTYDQLEFAEELLGTTFENDWRVAAQLSRKASRIHREADRKRLRDLKKQVQATQKARHTS